MTKETENTPKEVKDLSVYIDTIRQRFNPTDSESSATHKLSTKEIANAINELNPSIHATTEDVYNALSEAGFIFRSPSGMSSLQFKWLLVEK